MIPTRRWLLMLAAGLAVNAPSMAAACPAGFAEFWTQFAADAAFQKAHTADVISDSWADNGPVDVVQRSRTSKRSQLAFPLFVARRGDTVQVVGGASRRPVVKVRSPDSDANIVDLGFEKRGCWVLVSRFDASL